MDLSNENVIHVKENKNGNKVEYLQFRKLLKYSDKISHAYVVGLNQNFRTARPENEVLTKEEFDKAIEGYKNICEELELDYVNVIKPVQKHTNNVRVVKEKINEGKPNFDYFKETDGLITDKKNIVLTTTNADCILLLFYDPVKNIIANVHSGWRGTLQRISVNTVKKMKDEFESDEKDIICCICPSIRKCHFEVDRDVFELFNNEFQDLDNLEEIIEKRENKWHIDTVLINKTLMLKEGLKEENIIDSKICSVCNKEIIHSFRAEGKNFGLHTAVIGIK